MPGNDGVSNAHHFDARDDLKPPEVSGKAIIFFYTSSLANVLSPLARTLRDDHGFRVVLISTYKRLLPSPRFYDFNLDDFDEVHFCGDTLIPRSGDALPSSRELADQGWSLEQRYGVSALDFVRVDRMVGIDFVVGADFHRSKYGNLCSHDQALDVSLRLANEMEALLKRLRPVAVVGFPGSIFTNALISIGEAMGIPMRYLWAPRRGNLYSWICNRWGWHHNFRSSYEEELAAALNEESLIGGHSTSTEHKVSERSLGARNALRQQTSVVHLARTAYRHVRRDLPDIVRRRQPLYDSYLIREKLRLELQTWRWRRRALKEKPVFQSLPSDLPFIFFPLHVEPEISVMVECAKADNQLTLIDWLAKALPAGWRLLIKEHPAQASDRLPGFWEQVRRYPNVEVLATLERAEEVITKAKAVAVLNSTVGLQAANLALPVLTFHKHYLPGLMPHVTYCSSFEETRQALRDVAGEALPSPSHRHAAARAFDRALRRSEFPVTNKEMLAGKSARTPMAKHEFELMVELLLDSLPDTGNDDTCDLLRPDQSGQEGKG